MTQEQHNRLMRIASILSVATALFLAGLKAITFFVTGSVAILSSLFDSIQDMMTSLVNLIAVREATMPADKQHRFGHGKAQALGGLFQGFIITGAAIILFKESVERFFYPQPVQEVNFGLIITGIAIVLTIMLVQFQKYVIRKTNSLSIKADLTHYAGDIIMNIGVGVSILVSYLAKWYFVDALFGIVVSVYLIYSVLSVFKEAMNMLMDAEVSPDVRKQIKQIACSVEGVFDCFDLKTRLSGNEMIVQFSVSLDDNLTLFQAHNKIDEIEAVIHRQFPDMQLIIHPEPVSQNTRQNKKKTKTVSA